MTCVWSVTPKIFFAQSSYAVVQREPVESLIYTGMMKWPTVFSTNLWQWEQFPWGSAAFPQLGQPSKWYFFNANLLIQIVKSAFAHSS